MKLSDKILELRKKAGMSQEALAEKLSVSRQTVSRWELGSAEPDAGNLRELSKLFSVTADYLLNDDYESDGDIPRVREAEASLEKTEASLSEKTRTLEKFLLIGSAAFAVAAVAFLIAAIDSLNILFVVAALLNAILSGVLIFRYVSSKKKE